MFFACNICYEVLITCESPISSTYCGHVFHSGCIEKWLKEKNQCPQCRKYCDVNKIHPLFLSESSKESLISDMLLIAAKKGNTEVYKRMVHDEEDKNSKDFQGITNLHHSARNGHVKFANLFSI